jgi:hypothetical protein
MRYTILSGDKRATAPGARYTRQVVARDQQQPTQQSGAVEPLKFVLLKPNGQVERGELHTPLGDVKKSSRWLRPVETRLRKLARAQHNALGEYLVLHERSRRKRRNGWMLDLKSNLVKVIRHNT